MSKYKNLIIVLVLVAVVLAWFVYKPDSQSSNGDTATSTATTTIKEVESSKAKTTPAAKTAVVTPKASADSYVSLSYSTPHDAVFLLHTPVNDADIKNGKNIHYCALTSAEVNAGAACDHDQVVYGQGFEIKYTEAGGVLQITDVSYLNDRKPDLTVGAFKPTCTGCSVFIEFSNIRNEQGTVLPTKRVLVRAQ